LGINGYISRSKYAVTGNTGISANHFPGCGIYLAMGAVVEKCPKGKLGRAVFRAGLRTFDFNMVQISWCLGCM